MTNWKLQENVFFRKDLKQIANFITSAPKFTQGQQVKNFEKKFSQWNNSKYSIFVNSGSSANLITLNAAKTIYNWGDNDEIIVPTLTWPTTVTPIIQAGLKPVFLDCNFLDLSIDYNDLKKKITKKTKGIFLAHILGFPANIDRIKKIIKNKKILIMEDCCESTGAMYGGTKVGNFGIAGTFSFYWGHHMTTIEGGMITTNDKKFYDMCKLKRSHGMARELDPKDFLMIKKKFKKLDQNFLFLTDGFNLRSTEINAFIGIKQLKKLNNYIKIRNVNYLYFLQLIKKYEKNGIWTISPINLKAISSFAFPIFFKNSSHLKKFKKILYKNNIEFRPIISGNLLRQPFLKLFSNSMPNADIVHKNGIYIGNNQFVNKSRIDWLATLFDKIK
jgi:CDP-6-deoxy-D-xylo-4-hexulose-3-dehydrase